MDSLRSQINELEAKKFRNAVTRLRHFVLCENDSSKNTLSLLLDELISVESSLCKFETENEASELLGYLAHNIPLHLDKMVTKFCHVIVNFSSFKHAWLATSDLHLLVEYLAKALQCCPSFMHAEILSALCAVCENNTHHIEKFHDVLVGGQGLLLRLTDDTTCEDEVVVEAVRCLDVLTSFRPNQAELMEVRYLSASFDTFVHLLHRAPHTKMDVYLRNQLLIHCFSGIQNIITVKRLPNIELGILFAALRAYMFYGLTSQSVNIPSQLYPNVVTPYDPLSSSKFSKAAGNNGRKENVKREKKNNSTNLVENRGEGKVGAPGSGDKARHRRPRKKKGPAQTNNSVENSSSYTDNNHFSDSTYSKAGSAASVVSETCCDPESQSWTAAWLKLGSSESEFSDTEGGRARQQKAEMTKVRQCALTCFLSIVKVIDKKIMFGFWSSFLPDLGSSSQTPQLQQSLFTTILKDPSPRCRMAAVASLTNMLESTRPYLAAAEELSSHQSAFTPFSAVLGSMIREMHRCLLQALVAENFQSVLTQIIKCLANLVNNVPYHRLNPGLLTRVLKQIRHFYNHKDPNVRTACLTCIGAMVGIKPPLLEVSQLIKPPHNPVGVTRTIKPGDSPLFRPMDASYLLFPSYNSSQVSCVLEERFGLTEQLDDAQKEASTLQSMSDTQVDKSIKSDNDPELSALANEKINVKRSTHLDCLSLDSGVVSDQGNMDMSSNPETIDKLSDLGNMDLSSDLDNKEESSDPGIIDKTMEKRLSVSEVDDLFPADPVLGTSSGLDTPVFTDQVLQAHAREVSWVIKLCLKNITSLPEKPSNDENPLRSDATLRFEPLPVRLEALQVMSNIVKNYFPIIRHSFQLLVDMVQLCLGDPNHIIKLHGVKLLDEITQALHKDVVDASLAPSHVIPFQQVLDFWLFLLAGPLTQLLEYNPNISMEGNNLVRSAACECLANIGQEVFAKIPTGHQIQCITLVLGLCSDEDKLIRASAVRALGVYVMYSGLKEDVAFVLDASRAILSCMKCSSNTVRFKAAWAMANICDTLVINKDAHVEEFVSQFPDKLLLELVQCSASATKDCDKISCNSARAIGNLLRYMPAHCFQQPEMVSGVEAAVRGLVKNMNSGTMKVRWNSCYAASNAFQNPDLPAEQTWVTDILNMLSRVVQNCTNFKVRINAAMGLAAPATRRGYGTPEIFCHVWMSLVSALETAENINDFAEYKYKESLTEQLCKAVLHMTSLVDMTDVNTLSQAAHLKGHSFRIYVEKFMKLQLSKNAQGNLAVIESVKDHLDRLMTSAVSDDQRRGVQSLIQSCVPDTDSADERTPEKSSFKQIYD